MSQNLSGNLSGQIADMLEGSIAGNISLVSPSANIESKTITENGTYTAPSGVDGYNPITVNVPTPQPVIESKSITENGTYTAPSGVDGYNPITVNVPSPQPVIESKSITENGTYTAPSGVDGYNPITVNVPNYVRVTNQSETVELKVLSTGEIYLYFNNFVLQYGVSGFDVIDCAIIETLLNNFDASFAWTAQNYTSEGVQTDGHIGIYGRTLRGWSEDYGYNTGGTFNAVLHLTEESGNQNYPYNPIH